MQEDLKDTALRHFREALDGEGNFHPLRVVFNELQEEQARDADIRAYVNGSVRFFEDPEEKKAHKAAVAATARRNERPP